MQFIAIAEDILVNPEKISTLTMKKVDGKQRIVVTMDDGKQHIVDRNFGSVHSDLIRAGYTSTEQFWAG